MPNAAPDEIASLVLAQFDQLPQKRKPAVRDNGLHEWVPMSGIVAEVDGTLTCLSLATGMKCLPASKLPLANGTVLHDWHAEILAIRALNRFLLSECQSVAGGHPSAFIRSRTSAERSAMNTHESQPYALTPNLRLHMYCSEAPCGDASMELTMAAQTDASPWADDDVTTPPSTAFSLSSESDVVVTEPTLSGRGYFSHLGVVRRKPARGDAPPTLSKSCSDKLALKQCTSVLSSLTSLLIHPGNAYLSTLILPCSQFSASGCARSFSSRGRMASLVGREWEAGYAFRDFEVMTTDMEFAWSKREVEKRSGNDKTVASGLAVAWTANGLEEGMVGGVLQGRKQFDLRGAGGTSRRRLWELAAEVASTAEGSEEVRRLLGQERYGHVKEGELLEERRRVKSDVREEALKGWVRNLGDEDFGIGK